MAADSTKYVKLKRSDNCGFGFSILGGAGSEIPPIIYDVVAGSPAANSCQVYFNLRLKHKDSGLKFKQPFIILPLSEYKPITLR